MMPEIRKAPGVLIVDCESTGKFIRFCAAFPAALDSAVAPDGHNAALQAPEHASRQREIDDGLDVIDAELVLREFHVVDEHGVPHRAIEPRKSLHRFPRE